MAGRWLESEGDGVVDGDTGTGGLEDFGIT
jgi:hypothetical protein